MPSILVRLGWTLMQCIRPRDKWIYCSACSSYFPRCSLHAITTPVKCQVISSRPFGRCQPADLNNSQPDGCRRFFPHAIISLSRYSFTKAPRVHSSHRDVQTMTLEKHLATRLQLWRLPKDCVGSPAKSLTMAVYK